MTNDDSMFIDTQAPESVPPPMHASRQVSVYEREPMSRSFADNSFAEIAPEAEFVRVYGISHGSRFEVYDYFLRLGDIISWDSGVNWVALHFRESSSGRRAMELNGSLVCGFMIGVQKLDALPTGKVSTSEPRIVETPNTMIAMDERSVNAPVPILSWYETLAYYTAETYSTLTS